MSREIGNTEMKALNTMKWLAISSALAAVVGCGGNGSNPASVQAVAVKGGITTLVKTDAPAVPASTTGTPTEYTTTLGGVTKTVTIPASSDAFPASTPIAILPENVPIISGEFAARAPGDVEITRFSNSGAATATTSFSNIVSSTNGSIVLTKPLGLLPGEYYGTVDGPIYINGSGGKRLTVGSFGFRFSVSATGACSFPTSISGVLPVNGGHTGSGNISVTVSGSGLAGGSTSLDLTLSATTSVNQSGFYDSNNKFTFKSTQGGFRVPNSGVLTVEFDSYPPID